MEHLRCEGFTIRYNNNSYAFLYLNEHFCYSLRTLKRILHTLCLFRHGRYTERDSVTIIKECVLVSCQPYDCVYGNQCRCTVFRMNFISISDFKDIRPSGNVCGKSVVLDPKGCKIRRHCKLKRRLYFCKVHWKTRPRSQAMLQ